MIEPKWIEKDLVLTIHKMQISRFGGLGGVRDVKLLESALARAKHYYAFYNDQNQIIPRLACKYTVGIIQNHPFIDGNKRTGLISMHLFLYSIITYEFQYKLSFNRSHFNTFFVHLEPLDQLLSNI